MPYKFPDWIDQETRAEIELETARKIRNCGVDSDYAICVRYRGEPSGITGGIEYPDTRSVERFDARDIGIPAPPRLRPHVELVEDFGEIWTSAYREQIARVTIERELALCPVCKHSILSHITTEGHLGAHSNSTLAFGKCLTCGCAAFVGIGANGIKVY